MCEDIISDIVLFNLNRVIDICMKFNVFFFFTHLVSYNSYYYAIVKILYNVKLWFKNIK